MASIERRGSKWRVRWTCPVTRRARSRSCPDKATARQLQRAVEAAVALGEEWRPSDPPRGLVDELRRFLADYRRSVSRGRFVQVDRACTLLAMTAAERQGCALDEVPVTALSRDLYGALYDRCRAPKPSGRGNSKLTAWQTVTNAFAAWQWLWDEGVPGARRPRKPLMARPYVRHRAVYVGFDVLDLPVLHAMATGRDRRYVATMLVQRFTGLRQAQVRRLRTADVDAERLLMTIRPDDEKRPENGRTVPFSPLLAEELAMLGLPDRRLPTLVGGHAEPWSDHVYMRVWGGCGAPAEAWAGAPSKVFRSSLISFWTEQRVDREVIKRLVGHKLQDVTVASYTADAILLDRMRAAVALVPGLNRARLMVEAG